jgi:phosphatidylglycerophosphatase A
MGPDSPSPPPATVAPGGSGTTQLAVLIATVGYSGYFPIAPGTVGSAAGLLAYLIVWWTRSPIVEVALIAVLFAAGVWAGTTAERYFGGIDPGPVVIDEVVGMLITLFLIPVGISGAIAGFVLFRIFDIIKPYPAGRLEALHGGLGVMADDAMAAVYANLTLRAVLWLFPAWIS